MNMEADRFFGEISPPDLPLLRLYTWDRPTISFGCNQNPARRIDLAVCSRDRIPVVQRPTGGRELLHGHDLCYCMAMPHQVGMMALEAKEVFAMITDCLVATLAKMGITAEWRSLGLRPKAISGPCFAQTDAGEISVDGKKLVASAQRVFERCIIQEGSIPLVRPAVDLIDYLGGANKDSMRLIMNSNTGYLSEYLGQTYSTETVVELCKQAFSERFSGLAGPADELLQEFHRNNDRELWYYE
jgi:lipoate-protein ligase A